jgi:hypothetical protein
MCIKCNTPQRDDDIEEYRILAFVAVHSAVVVVGFASEEKDFFALFSD